MAHTTETLHARFLAGDPDAIGRVGRWVAEILTSPRFWRLRNEWRDLHQEVLARVLESVRTGRYDASRDLRLYVRGIASHAALERLRAAPPSVAAELDGLPFLRASDAERRALMLQFVRRVLDLASEECRRLIADYFLQQRSYAEIAHEQDLPVGTVKSRLFRCLESAHHAVSRSTLVRPRAAERTS